MLVILALLVLICLCLVSGITSLVSGYKIYVRKDYSSIEVGGIGKPKYPERIAAKVALINVATGICFFCVIPAIKLFGVVNSVWTSVFALIIILLIKRKVIASGNSET